MNAQESILRNCNHPHKPCEVEMGHGEIIWTCAACFNASVYARRAERRAYLDSLPRCEVPGCKHRQTVILAGIAHLCGRHAKKAQGEFSRQFSGFGILAMIALATLTKRDILELSTKGDRKA